MLIHLACVFAEERLALDCSVAVKITICTRAHGGLRLCESTASSTIPCSTSIRVRVVPKQGKQISEARQADLGSNVALAILIAGFIGPNLAAPSSGAIMDNQVLRGVVANVQVTKAALTCGVTKRLLERELDELGAKTLARLTKSCTHIVFQRKTDEPSDEDRAADEETARQLSVKAEKVCWAP